MMNKFIKTFDKLKRGVKAMVREMKDEKISKGTIDNTINMFMASEQRKLALTGDRYYQVDNDIKQHRNYEIDKKTGAKKENLNQANNRYAHGQYKNMVDEKVSYTFSREYTLNCDDQNYLEQVQELLTNKFPYKIMKLGYEASNKGIGWLHPYIDEQGAFKVMIVPYERFIPIWKDNEHEELIAGIYFYDETYYNEQDKKIRTHAEYWTADGVTCYIKEDKKFCVDFGRNFDEAGNTVSHFMNRDEWCAWGRVPFIPFKNNFIETPDIKFVKSLVDGYDSARSEAANYIDDVRNLLYVVKGYGNTDENEVRDMIRKRIIFIDGDDDEDNGVTTLSPSTDLTAIIAHCEQLKRDIIESGQGVLKDLDKFGNSPSGVALSFMYSLLDLKASAMCVQFTFGFQELMYFVNSYLNLSNTPEITITFNMNMKVNESENLDNCQKAKNLGLSKDTWLQKCAWVDDVQKELDALEENEIFKDKVPTISDEK